MPECPTENAPAVDQSHFWDSDGLHWDAHRIGWAVSGGCALLTLIISFTNVYQHARHYVCPPEQRQIIRILYMPPIFAIVSFFSYRFFRSYTYYSLIEIIYEAFTIAAFLMLIVEYVASTASGHSAHKALERKDKRPLPIPFCCWRYRPTKAYFMHTVKWSVLQYVIVRPVVSIVGIIAQTQNVLCENEGFDFHFVNVYLEIVDFVSITVALYGLLVFYGLTKEELAGRRPLAKFMCIKLIVFFTFYQAFVFTLLEGRVIHETAYWTETNIADGLNALATTIEMVFFAALMMWAYRASEYTVRDDRKTKIWRALWDSINFSDFVIEIWTSLKFYIDYYRGRPYTRSGHKQAHFDEAFGVEMSYNTRPAYPGAPSSISYNGKGGGMPGATAAVPGGGYDLGYGYGEDVQLSTYNTPSPPSRGQVRGSDSSETRTPRPSDDVYGRTSYDALYKGGPQG